MFRFNGFTQKANDAINLAIAKASALGHGYIGSEHILIGLHSAQGSSASLMLISKGVVAQELIELLIQNSGRGQPTVLNSEHLTPCCRRIFEAAVTIAKEYKSLAIGTEHLLIAVLQENQSSAMRMLRRLKIDVGALYKAISDIAANQGGLAVDKQQKDKTPTKASKPVAKTPNLDKFSRDLTQMAREGKLDPVIGREKEIKRVIRILSRRSKNNPCLIGEAGVGKTAVVEGLAQCMVDGDVPKELAEKRLASLDLASVLAGTKYRGDFEERIKSILSEVALAGNVVLFIDELHNMMGVGAAEGAIDAANILKPQLARGEIQLIGATTFEEYRRNIEKDSALERRFQSVTVSEPTQEQAIEILKGIKSKYEQHHNLAIPEETIVSAVKLSSRFISDRFLPDKAIDLIDEAAASVKLDNITGFFDKTTAQRISAVRKSCDDAMMRGDFQLVAELREANKDILTYRKSQNSVIELELSPMHIAQVISQITGIEVSALTQEETQRLADLEDKLSKMVIGQKEAIVAVSKAVRRSRVGLRDPQRPIGSFLFLGPTGVGKTELCKALSLCLFGSKEAMIRLDMSEYMEKQSVSKLIGSPPGYVGYDDGGQLTEKIRRKPYSLVLLDEIEKAHPDVLHILLQLLEEGTLTDTHGRSCNFKNSIIIMTSNIGATKITQKNSLGFSYSDLKNSNSDIKREVLAELKKLFKPELLNRIDQTVVFSSLTKEELTVIAQKLLDEVGERVKAMGIEVEFSSQLAEFVAQKGSDVDYGARPLRRFIQTNIEDLFAQQLIEEKIALGEKVICTLHNNEIKLFNTSLSQL